VGTAQLDTSAKLVGLATVEPDPQLALALRKMGRVWENTAAIAHSQVCLNLGLPSIDLLGRQRERHPERLSWLSGFERTGCEGKLLKSLETDAYCSGHFGPSHADLGGRPERIQSRHHQATKRREAQGELEHQFHQSRRRN
jgi:hypothetical protein